MQPEEVTDSAPRPAGRALFTQGWRDVAFVHWAVDPAVVAPLLPPGTRPDEHDGRSWVGLVPFRMRRIGVLGSPGLPWVGSFLETNVRLYSVDAAGRRGVVFLSLDCDRLAIVLGARTVLGLPYRWTHLHHTSDTVGDDRVRHHYEGALPRSARRRPPVGPGSRVVVDAGPVREADGLDTFLSARWGLHTRRAGKTFYVPNRHEVWPLRETSVVELRTGGLLASVGLADLEDREPDHVAFSDGVHAEFGLPRDRPPVTAGPSS